MKRLWITTLLLIGALAGGACFWWYTTTPYHTLAELKSSIETNDWEKFCQWVDVETLSQELSKDFAGVTETTLEDKDTPKIFSKGITALVTIKMKPVIMEDLENWISGEDSRMTEKFASGDSVEISLDDLDYSEKSAEAFIGLGNGRTLQLEMEKTGGRWIVKRIGNAQELLEKK